MVEFLGTASESVWCHPRNICAKFGGSTQKFTITMISLSDPTIQIQNNNMLITIHEIDKEKEKKEPLQMQQV